MLITGLVLVAAAGGGLWMAGHNPRGPRGPRQGLLPEATRNPTPSMCSADDSAGMRQKKTPP